MAHRNDIPIWVLPMNLVLSLAVAVLGAWVWLLSSHRLPRDQLEALQLVHDQIADEYVTPPPSEDLMWSAIEGMVGSLDRHSQFVRPSKVAEFEEDTTGTYAGIGIVMAGVIPLTVKFPFAGGPAERAGLLVGDRIVAVDGEPLVASDAKELATIARERLLGDAGSPVQLTIERGEGETTEKFEQVVVRGNVTKPSIRWVRALDEDRRIGYAYVVGFHKDTTVDLVTAIGDLDALVGGTLGALILDLRFNRGGLLEEAISMANLFVAEGTIVSVKRRDSDSDTNQVAEPDRCARPKLPLVLLVNHDSASASEVVAGALQDHGRATVVGVRTWGKGVVQSIFSWRDLDFRLKLTTAHYYTPNGRSIEGEYRRSEDGEAEGGIAPDRTVAIDKSLRQRLGRALYSANEPPVPYREQVARLSKKLELDPSYPPGPDIDTQLTAALEEARRLLDAAATESK